MGKRRRASFPLPTRNRPMPAPFAAVVAACAFLAAPLAAQDAVPKSDGEAKPEAAVKPDAAEAKGPSLEERRREIVRFGTDAELISLVAALDSEGARYLDAELVALAESTGNSKILVSVFDYFRKREDRSVLRRAVRAVEDRDEEVPATVDAAVSYLGGVRAKEAAPALRALVESEEKRYAAASVRALGRCGDEGDAAFLVDFYAGAERGDDVKHEIVVALGELGSKAGTEFLVELLGSDEAKPVRRMAALEALGKIADPAGLDAVLARLRDEDANVRAAAIAALGPFKGEAVEKTILEAFRDSFYKARSAAAKAAGERKLASAVPSLAYRAANDDVPAVREDAVRALGKIATGDAKDAVFKVFSDKKTPERVRSACAPVMLELDAAAAVRPLSEALAEAKKAKRTALYHGIAKPLSKAVHPSTEELARSFLASTDIVDRHYGLDLAVANGFRSLVDAIEPLAKDKSETLAKKAKDALKALGSSSD